MRFIKIKVGKELIELHYDVMNASNKYDRYILQSKETPDPAFSRNMREMGNHIAEMCELGDNKGKKIEGRGVHFDYSGEREDMGVVITGIKKLEFSNGILNLVTPHKVKQPTGVNMSEKQVLTGDCEDDIKVLKELATKFIQGHRAQIEMFGGNQTDKGRQEEIDLHNKRVEKDKKTSKTTKDAAIDKAKKDKKLPAKKSSKKPPKNHSKK